MQTCLECAAALPSAARFCASCGRAVLPQGGTTAAPRLSGERRPVTALFADIVDSTRLAAHCDPEDWANAVNRIFRDMSEAVSRYEGTVAQLAGDGLLAIFGAPVAHEDDPERAVRAGLDLVALIQEAAGELLPGSQDDLSIRVGISTGPVVVGTVGGELRSEYTALGDAVNVAARMQAAARPGRVLVTAETYRHVASVVEVLDLGPIVVKGKEAPVHAYEVVDLRADVLSRASSDSPLVGRADELAHLEEALAAVVAGRGRTALVLGEPGIGKSRLVQELQTRASELGEVQWAQGRCLSFGANLAYHLVVDLVRGLVVLPAGEHGLLAREVLDKTLEDLPGTDAVEAADLAHLLGLPLEGVERQRLEALEPAAVQARYLAALRKLVGGVSAVRPLVVVCEDVHWADPSSVDLLTRLLPAVEETPLLLVLIGRPERDVPGWRLVGEVRTRFGEALIELTLGPLPQQVSRELADTLAVRHPLAQRLSHVVAAKAEGNPLFVEELVRMLLDRLPQQANVAVDGATLAEIPDNLHALLLARIDRLPGAARRLLGVAAVIGREFPAALLDEVVAQETDADASGRRLGTLEAAGLLRMTSARPELVYAFRHALIQEAAYSSLLRSERRRLHMVVGGALERLYPQRRGELAGQLARHFEQAGREERAAPYQLEAGQQALRRFAHREALDLLEKAAAHAGRTGDDDRSLRFRLATLLGLGEARRANGDIPTAKATFEEAAALARDRSDVESLARAALGYGKASDVWGVDETLRGLLEDALTRLGEDPGPLRARVMARLAQALYYDPDQERRRELIDAAVHEARHLDDDAALAEVLSARHTLGGPDDLDQRLDDATRVVEIAQRIGDWDLELRGRGWRVVDLLAGGHVEAAWQEMEQHAELARRLNDPLHLRDVIAWQAMRAALTGRFAEAESLVEEAYRIGHEAGDPSASSIRRIQWQMIASQLGITELVEELAASLREMMASSPAVAPALKLVLAAFYSWFGHRDEAHAWLDAGYEDFTEVPRSVVWLDQLCFAADASSFVGDIARATQLYGLLRPYTNRLAVSDRARTVMGSVSRSLGLLATLLGRFDEAEAHFEAALDHHERLGSPPLVALTQVGYAQMLRARGRPGDHERAAELHRRAHALADDLGMELPDDEHWPVNLRQLPASPAAGR
ncbi:MAG: AAA family ATPase [Actinomycetota bacterium]|nr:AAA family ATPase [Actinomycetota bacterium]